MITIKGQFYTGQTNAGENLLSSNQTVRSWVIIIILLVVFAVVTAVWSTLIGSAPVPSLELGGGGAPAAIPVETENIDFEIKPIQLTMRFPSLFGLNLGGFDITLLGNGVAINDINPIVAIGALFALVIGGIAVVGGAIATPIMFGARLVENTKESEAYKENVAKLQAEEKQMLKQMNEGRTTHEPDHERPVWSSVATALIILMFAYFIGRVLDGTFFPEGLLITEEGRLIRTTPYFVWGTMLAGLLGILAWIRPQTITLPESADFSGIPWDTIAVIMTGLVVVGLGIGAMVWVLSGSGAAG